MGFDRRAPLAEKAGGAFVSLRTLGDVALSVRFGNPFRYNASIDDGKPSTSRSAAFRILW